MRSLQPTVAVRVLVALLLAMAMVLPTAPSADAGGDVGWTPTPLGFQDDDDGGGDDDDFVPAPPPAPVAPVAPPPAETGGGSVADDDQPGVVYAPLGGIVDDDGDPTTDGYRGGQVVVRVTPGTDLAAFTARHGARELASILSREIYLLQIPAGIAEDDYVEALVAADDAVVWAEPNGINQAPEGRPTNFFPSGDADDRPPEDPYHADLLGLPAVNGCASGNGAVVAVVDTGVDATHPALDGRVLPGGFNALDGSAETSDAGNGVDDDADGDIDEMTGHGTHVAGIILQAAPDVEILPVTALDSDGLGDAFLLAEAVFYAIDAGVEVINLSLGSTRNPRAVADAVAEANDAGIVVAAAAGNLDRERPMEYPAADPNALGIAATDTKDAKSEFSNYGEMVDLAAPGTDITSTYPGGDYASWSGTSMATPFAAAAAALLLAADPEMAVADVVGRLAETAASLEESAPDHAADLGAGRLDIAAALGCD